MTRQTITERLAGGGGRRRQVGAAAGTIVVVAIVIGIVVGAGEPTASKGQGTGSTSTGATTVQRRDLVQTDTESGTLGYANAQTVFNRLSGTITYLPAVGQVVSPGGTLYQVNGYPVILFNGSYPAYRNLSSSDSNGPDIEELNADLKAMGFDPYDEITVDDAWQTGTTDAVDRFQASLGRTETGKLTLGRIVFLPGPQLINAVDTTIGSTGGSAGTGSSPGSGTGAAYTGPSATPKNVSDQSSGPPHAEFVSLTSSTAPPPAHGAPPATTTTPTGTTPTGTTPTGTTPSPSSPMSATPGTSNSALQAIIRLLSAQNRLLEAELKAAAKGSGSKSPSSTSGAKSPSGTGTGSAKPSSSAASTSAGSSANHGSGNTGSGSATAILSTTSTNLVVTVQLDATKQSEAKLHEPVTVQLPDGSTVNGRITGVSPVATTTNSGSSSASPSNSAPAATIPVTISLDKHANTRGLDQAAVSVNFAAQVANHVLSVPVTALLATQGGGYAIQLAAPPHRLVAVTPGLFAAGYVQVSGPGVQDGMQVTDSQG